MNEFSFVPLNVPKYPVFPLDYDRKQDGSYTQGVNKSHFSGIEHLISEYADPELYAALVLNINNRGAYVGICRKSDPHVNGFCRFPISRFVTSDLLVQTINDKTFLANMAKFISDPENKDE